ncbi:hypothetical protein FB567DRAFT_56646 [Paraphoma chrysanthemicola]|uniref:Subtilisin-like serine protease n=1 Tax=Paraphoma chrysanthemicola TaxID=798071 RepID=A0A8K0R7I4_9PLEO|nr:hypothetical protein FB567DRAFT_56646 [Paraphoma chrysanthemicola]
MASTNPEVPFESQHQLFSATTTTTTVPGQPCVSLNDSDAVNKFLLREISVQRLDDMYSILFLVSKRQNISPLHHQIIKGRQILITERPDLHLIWYHDRIFIKPVPLSLVNYNFYNTCILGKKSDQTLHAAACGFLRTYASLIVHETDYNIAKAAGLLPFDTDWNKWCHFIKRIQHLKDAQVARRYHYGELRLIRLNFYSKIFFYGWSYHEVYYQYVEYFARFYAPYLFIFGAVTVILAAMQTALTADPGSQYKASAHWFCTLAIALTIVGLAFFPGLFLFFQLRELFLFIFYRQKKRK